MMYEQTINDMVITLAKQLEQKALESFGVDPAEIANHAPSAPAIAMAEDMLTKRFERLLTEQQEAVEEEVPAPVMQYNTCDHCGANNGRAGMLFGTGDREGMYCQNCHDTDQMGDVVIHAGLNRTEEELAKTMELVRTIVPMYPDEISEDLINDAREKLPDDGACS